MNAQDLKNSVLQLAIQGKLVDQREEEGSAKGFLENIEIEKMKLIKEGKIKKQKALPTVKEDEIPFDIPESWEWARVGDIGSWSAGATPSRSNSTYYGGAIPWLKTGDLNDGYINEVPEFISEEALNKTSVRLNPVGSILMAMYGATIGKLGILNIEATTNQACCACVPYSIIFNKYLFYYLMSQRRAYIKMGAGGAQPNISKEKIINSIIPIPPLSEQERIVAKIEDLMPYVDKYDVAYSEVENLNKKFPEYMQKSILQYAIQGKLVEQREEDGTAEELYQQIQKEKEKLIKDGSIKKTTVLPEITEDEIPFEIPENWKWIRLGNLSSLITKGTTPRGGNVSYIDKGIGFLRAENVAGFDKLNLEDMKFVDESTHNTLLKRSILEENDILITIAGTLGRTAIVDKNSLPLNANQAVSLTRLIKSDLLNLKYLVYAINAPIIQSILIGKKKTTAIPNLTLEIINDCILPLPPLSEQKRIVEKVEKLFPYSKQLAK